MATRWHSVIHNLCNERRILSYSIRAHVLTCSACRLCTRPITRRQPSLAVLRCGSIGQPRTNPLTWCSAITVRKCRGTTVFNVPAPSNGMSTA